MAGDHYFYHDFNSEIKLENWTVIQQESHRITLQCKITRPEGNYIFLAPCVAEDNLFQLPCVKSIAVNGNILPLRKDEAVYVHDLFARYGLEFRMLPGENQFTVELYLHEGVKYDPSKPLFALIPPEAPPAKFTVTREKHRIEAERYRRVRDDFDPAGWKNGIGHRKSPGRFGFSKGDGLLDCAMPALGIVDKMFLCGQEKYRKAYRWN